MTKEPETCTLDDFNDLYLEFVHLARLALSARGQDIEVFLRRVARRLRQEHPSVSAELIDLLRQAPTRSSPLRDAGSGSATPVDLDSRSPLVRHEWPISLHVQPIFEPEVKAVLSQIVTERRKSTRLLEAGLSPTRSALFTGPPGVGKTLAARWIASELNQPLLVLDLSAVMSSFLGRTGNNLRRVLDYAKDRPTVLLLDELDAIAKRRDDQVEIGELKRLVTVLLQEIDDWPSTSLLLAATNHSNLLDPAAWRRFEVVVDFPLPTVGSLQQSVSALLREEAVVDGDIVAALAHTFIGNSFSDVERDILMARRSAVATDRELKEVLIALTVGRAEKLSFADRKKIAVDLVARNVLSQRRASELLRVSRDTIRDAIRNDEKLDPDPEKDLRRKLVEVS
ncbi:MAG: AAA family ATPase [Pseudonocardiales bacterium]|nr:AAA family ATPase [Pseudonocardiales bacterium]